MASTVSGLAFAIVLITLFAAVGANFITDFDPNKANPVDRFFEWGQEGHRLGTDQLGRDTFTRLIYGARLVWVVGLSVSLLAMAFGGVLGSLAGYLGGRVDGLIGRISDGVLAFPPLLLALVMSAVIGPSTAERVTRTTSGV